MIVDVEEHVLLIQTDGLLALIMISRDVMGSFFLHFQEYGCLYLFVIGAYDDVLLSFELGYYELGSNSINEGLIHLQN